MKQKTYIAGLYYRLSQEDERQGESVSIDNQRTMLRKYAEEHGFEIHDEYIDDGVSGTTFDRPEVQRLLDDAKTGVINTIIVKDLSRFGRNYIEVGQYVDYVFPAFGIRFIAIQDNVGTENRDSGAMEMMPIMNVFNEWHAANTSKKIRAVRRSNALAGIYSAKKATYGYLKGTDKKRTPVIDEETAPVVRRIFELYAAGTSPKNIADILNAENIPSPGKLAYERLGHKGRPNEMRLWCEVSIRFMLNNITYIGHLPMLQETTVSYKNHKRQAKDRSDWVITYNNHEPIIPQELWDRVQERQKHMAQGRKALGLIYSGDATYVMAENENMGYYMPESGTNLWSDAMVIPKNAQNPELAHAFINFASDYDGAYDNSSYVGYTSANEEVMEVLSGEGGDYEGINAYIPRTDNENDEVFVYNEDTKKIISDLWSRVKIAASNAD